MSPHHLRRVILLVVVRCLSLFFPRLVIFSCRRGFSRDLDVHYLCEGGGGVGEEEGEGEEEEGGGGEGEEEEEEGEDSGLKMGGGYL